MAVSTMRQQKLGREIVEDIKKGGKPRNKKELLLEVGYAESVATHKPGEIFNQEGTIRAIDVALESAGLSEARADEVVNSILTNLNEEGQVRLKAADLVYKRTGSYAAEKSVSLTANLNTDELKSLIVGDMNRFRGRA